MVSIDSAGSETIMYPQRTLEGVGSAADARHDIPKRCKRQLPSEEPTTLRAATPTAVTVSLHSGKGGGMLTTAVPPPNPHTTLCNTRQHGNTANGGETPSKQPALLQVLYPQQQCEKNCRASPYVCRISGTHTIPTQPRPPPPAAPTCPSSLPPRAARTLSRAVGCASSPRHARCCRRSRLP